MRATLWATPSPSWDGRRPEPSEIATGIPMRELDRDINDTSPSPAVAVVGRGRLGGALAAALGAGPALGRGEAPPPGSEAVILAVPDGALAAAAAALAPGPAVGHCAGALGLDVLAPHRERFSLHPL